MTTPAAVNNSRDRVERIQAAIKAHAGPIEMADRGALRISWSDGDVRVVLETHFGKEPPRG